jgi:hypothetical protein
VLEFDATIYEDAGRRTVVCRGWGDWVRQVQVPAPDLVRASLDEERRSGH